MWLLDNLAASPACSGIQISRRAATGGSRDARVGAHRRRLLGFVRLEGRLVMTNHHCAARCLSQLSTAEKNLAAAGFLAHGRQEEARCPEIELNRLERITDVTGEVKGATARPRRRGIQGRAKCRQGKNCRRLASAPKNKPRAATSSISITAAVTISTNITVFRTSALPGGPEQAVAFFGGDPDNFNFPRYDLDIALLRAYETAGRRRRKTSSRSGKTGAEAGETVFVTGHPGSTQPTG